MSLRNKKPKIKKGVAVVVNADKEIGFNMAEATLNSHAERVYITSSDSVAGITAMTRLQEVGFAPELYHLIPTDPKNVAGLARQIKLNEVGIDLLINNAAVPFYNKKDDLEKIVKVRYGIEAEMTMNTNFFTVLAVWTALSPLLRPGAKVINIIGAEADYTKVTNDTLRYELVARSLSIPRLTNYMWNYVQAARWGVSTERGWPKNPLVVSNLGMNSLSVIQQREMKNDKRENIKIVPVHKIEGKRGDYHLEITKRRYNFDKSSYFRGKTHIESPGTAPSELQEALSKTNSVTEKGVDLSSLDLKHIGPFEQLTVPKDVKGVVDEQVDEDEEDYGVKPDYQELGPADINDTMAFKEDMAAYHKSALGSENMMNSDDEDDENDEYIKRVPFEGPILNLNASIELHDKREKFYQMREATKEKKRQARNKKTTLKKRLQPFIDIDYDSDSNSNSAFDSDSEEDEKDENAKENNDSQKLEQHEIAGETERSSHEEEPKVKKHKRLKKVEKLSDDEELMITTETDYTNDLATFSSIIEPSEQFSLDGDDEFGDYKPNYEEEQEQEEAEDKKSVVSDKKSFAHQTEEDKRAMNVIAAIKIEMENRKKRLIAKKERNSATKKRKVSKLKSVYGNRSASRRIKKNCLSEPKTNLKKKVINRVKKMKTEMPPTRPNI